MWQGSALNYRLIPALRDIGSKHNDGEMGHESHQQVQTSSILVASYYIERADFRRVATLTFGCDRDKGRWTTMSWGRINNDRRIRTKHEAVRVLRGCCSVRH